MMAPSRGLSCTYAGIRALNPLGLSRSKRGVRPPPTLAEEPQEWGAVLCTQGPSMALSLRGFTFSHFPVETDMCFCS